MIQIKIFNDNGHQEEDINMFLKENLDIKVVNIVSSSMYDLYNGQEPRVCNQWREITLIYEIENKI